MPITDIKSPKLVQALRLAESGFLIFPLRKGSKKPEHGEDWGEVKTKSIKQIQKWFEYRPSMNYGINLGDSFVAVDVDDQEAWARIEDKHGKAPETLTQATPKGGKHLIYRVPYPVTNSNKFPDGIDVRGHAGYVVGAGSELLEGYCGPQDKPGTYECEAFMKPADAPDWMFQYLQPAYQDRSDQRIAKGAPVDADKLREVLSYLNPECDRATWIKVLAGLRGTKLAAGIADQEAPDGLTIADDWSAGRFTSDGEAPSNYQGHKDVEKEWETLTPDKVGGAGFGTLVYNAKLYGYRGRKVDLPAEIGETLPMLATDDKGRIYKSFKNAMISAEFMSKAEETKLSYNDLSHEYIFRGKLPWAKEHGRVLDDHTLRLVRLYWMGCYSFECSIDNVQEALKTQALKNRYNPVVEYLTGLSEWDGVPRLDTWLADHLGAEDTPYTRAVGRKTLLGAVARAFDPGCKFDTVLTLQGPQGCGKSTAVAILGGRWFSDNLPSELKGKDAVQSLQGKWIIECAEMDGFTRSQVVTAKAFITRQIDRERFAYDRFMPDRLRRCIFIATTNEDSFLRDPTGARRFWPIKVAGLNAEGLRAARDQLFAEAVHAYLFKGESLILPRELWPVAAEEQEERYARDPWEETIAEWLEGHWRNKTCPQLRAGATANKPPLNKVRTSELLSNALGLHKAAQTQNHFTRLRAIMEKRLKWTYRRNLKIGGINAPGYVKAKVVADR